MGSAGFVGMYLARRPFLVAGDPAFHVMPDTIALQSVTIQSSGNVSQCSPASFTAPLVPLSATKVVPLPVSLFTPPIHPEQR